MKKDFLVYLVPFVFTILIFCTILVLFSATQSQNVDVSSGILHLIVSISGMIYFCLFPFFFLLFSQITYKLLVHRNKYSKKFLPNYIFFLLMMVLIVLIAAYSIFVQKAPLSSQSLIALVFLFVFFSVQFVLIKYILFRKR